MGRPSPRWALLLLAVASAAVSGAAGALSDSYACCLALGSSMQLWWNVNSTSIFDFALTTQSSSAWMAFGPAQVGTINRLMGGADAAAGGFFNGVPWADDLYMSQYLPCDFSTTPAQGVCPDSALGASSSGAVGDVKLQGSSQTNGVTTLMMTRPLAATNARVDVPISLSANRSYIWARGELSTGTLPPSSRLVQHALSGDDYGTVVNFALLSCPAACAPLQGFNAPPAPRVAGFMGPVLLIGGGISLQWRIHDGGVTFLASAQRPATWASIAIGNEMVGAHAYVAWAGASDTLRVDSYAMTTLSADGVKAVPSELLSATTATRSAGSGLLTFSFFRPFVSPGAPPIDPASMTLIWALGTSWSAPPTASSQHFARSDSGGTTINLLTGAAFAGAQPKPLRALVAHAALMYIAYAVAGPAAIFFARYTKEALPPSAGKLNWFSLHRSAALGAVLLALAGAACALALQVQTRGTVALMSRHAKYGVAALVLFAAQPINAALRPAAPPKPAGQAAQAERSRQRRAWELGHRLGAIGALVLAGIALFTGITESCGRGMMLSCGDLRRGLIVWLVGLGVFVLVRETVAAAAAVVPALAPRRDSESGGSPAGSAVPSPTPAGPDSDPEGKQRAHVKRHAERRWAVTALGWTFLVGLFAALVAGGSIGSPSVSGLVVAVAPQTPPPAAPPPPAMPPPPSPPLPPGFYVQAAFSVGGYTVVSFDAAAASRFSAGLASALSINASAVTITSVQAALPSPSVAALVTQPAGARRALLQAAGVVVSATIRAAGSAEQADLARAVPALPPAALATALVRNGLAAATTAAVLPLSINQVSVAFPPPTPPSPPRPPLPPAVPCGLTRASDLARLGDGWCDAGAPYNVGGCQYDGGDCCNVNLPLFDCVDPGSANYGRSSPKGLATIRSAPQNPRYTAASVTAGTGRSLSTQDLVGSFNNYYEFTTSKAVNSTVTPAARAAMEVGNPSFPGWTVTVGGLVANPMSLDVRQLADLFPMETRVYRHRCVEAWSIIVPWNGTPLRRLLTLAQPLPTATHVRFESSVNSKVMQGVAQSPSGFGDATWPYVEGLTIAEAMHDLAFLSFGMFNQTLPAQSGAPLRLTLPWKYGFKSIKSITKVTLVNQQPTNWWNKIAPSEYGFYANVNPAFSHPRWTQAREQALVGSSYGLSIPTALFNGYNDSDLAAMYGTDRSFFY